MLDVTKVRALAAERFVELVRQMSAEPAYATKAAVAKRLGVHPSIVSQIMNGTRNSVGAKSVDSAIKNLGIDPEFFYGEFAETPDYKAFMPGEMVVERPARYPEIDEFLETPFGSSCSAEEVERLKDQAYKGKSRPTNESLQFLVFSFRAERRQAHGGDPDDASDVIAAAERRAIARGGRIVDIHSRAKEEG